MEKTSYTEEEFELTQQLINYWVEGRVSSDSMWEEEDGTVAILWHSC